MHLADLIPDANVLLALEPDELGLHILQVLQSWPAHMQQYQMSTFINSVVGPSANASLVALCALLVAPLL
jgi:hypothetical protein